jgi:NAD(P)-dependent dehydrogenase (short-subunit alcohol dehydrogenase family)
MENLTPSTYGRPVVVVTGAAGGIGIAIVDRFVDSGCDVVALDRKPLEHPGIAAGHVRNIEVDVTDSSALKVIAASIGPINHLVTVAGGALEAETTTTTGLVPVTCWEDSIRVNLTSAYGTLLAFKSNLGASQGDRSVTFISSINAIQGYGLVAYSAAKAGLSGMMNALVVPLGRDGIRVNCVLPGTTPTPRTRQEWAHVPDHFTRMAAGSPIGRLGAPEDVADAVHALALTLTHVHGVELVVDGGQSRSR